MFLAVDSTKREVCQCLVFSDPLLKHSNMNSNLTGKIRAIFPWHHYFSTRNCHIQVFPDCPWGILYGLGMILCSVEHGQKYCFLVANLRSGAGAPINDIGGKLVSGLLALAQRLPKPATNQHPPLKVCVSRNVVFLRRRIIFLTGCMRSDHHHGNDACERNL
jgi:hypothetical protein